MLSQRGRSWEARVGWGCRAPQHPGRALGHHLPSPGPPARTSGGYALGAQGRAGGPGAGHRGENWTNRYPGLGPELAPRKEIPVEESPGTARREGSPPRRSRAIAQSPADAGGARVSERKRLSHFLRSPHSSAPSAPDLPSLSPAPFPKPAAHVGAQKTRNLNSCSVRRLPPRRVSSRSQPPACPPPPALPTISGAPEGSPWAMPTQSPCSGLSPCWDEPTFKSSPLSSCQHPSSHFCPAACLEPELNHSTQTGNKYLLCYRKFDQLPTSPPPQWGV